MDLDFVAKSSFICFPFALSLSKGRDFPFTLSLSKGRDFPVRPEPIEGP